MINQDEYKPTIFKIDSIENILREYSKQNYNITAKFPDKQIGVSDIQEIQQEIYSSINDLDYVLEPEIDNGNKQIVIYVIPIVESA